MKQKLLIILTIFIIINVYQLSSQTAIIPDSSIRLRVIPNSNDPEDINIKEQVKTYLEKNVYDLTKDINNIENARAIIKNNIPNIEESITNIFNDNSYTLSYKVSFGYNYFPEKLYQGVKYDKGYYESLVISIGNAKGDNWWCVLFPNFCLIDNNNNKEYKLYFKEMLKK